MKNIFKPEITNEIIERINKLQSTSAPIWGKMTAGQMLAHCNVTYEMIYETKHKPAKGFKKILLKLFVKNIVVNEKPYKKNGPTAPAFKIEQDRNFEPEKNRLITYIRKTQELGESYFEGKESNSFGTLTVSEWNNMLYKHLDHHLSQFGV